MCSISSRPRGRAGRSASTRLCAGRRENKFLHLSFVDQLLWFLAREPLPSRNARAFSFVLTPARHPIALIGGEASRLQRTEGKVMKRGTVLAGVFFAIVAAPLTAQAQG